VRIKCSPLQKVGAAIAGMALTHTVGRAIWQGIFTSGRPFVRTPKCADQPALMQGILMARDEIYWLLALVFVAVAVLYNFTPQNEEALLWSTAVLVQALPFAAALITSMCNAVPMLFNRHPPLTEGAASAAE